MKSTEFKITVSGAALEKGQVAHASAQMNVALLTALVGEGPAPVKGPVWSNILLNGGRIFLGELAEKLQKAADQELGGGG
ncbi:hypothetical protein RI103_33005 [Paraburkholderia sp. FT54]|jgi:hypothetical protein|uniref:hypothetical protein n=1 Tax=Paraburkholderia sp. FT54 TaxID=3074437 RepID=UPI002877D7F2|nr:hypothetical protein [Paraburkholderia sp. FT54]WNC94766.1 hypothetical protein RI103_33005 [Paraburkholderia sp. FT54]